MSGRSPASHIPHVGQKSQPISRDFSASNPTSKDTYLHLEVQRTCFRPHSRNHKSGGSSKDHMSRPLSPLPIDFQHACIKQERPLSPQPLVPSQTATQDLTLLQAHPGKSRPLSPHLIHNRCCKSQTPVPSLNINQQASGRHSAPLQETRSTTHPHHKRRGLPLASNHLPVSGLQASTDSLNRQSSDSSQEHPNTNLACGIPRQGQLPSGRKTPVQHFRSQIYHCGDPQISEYSNHQHSLESPPPLCGVRPQFPQPVDPRRPLSPIPSNIQRPVLPTVSQNRPTLLSRVNRPMSPTPRDIQRPLSPIPCEHPRSKDILRPLSPHERTTSSHIQRSTPQRPLSSLQANGQRSLSPPPAGHHRMMSPTTVDHSRPCSPLSGKHQPFPSYVNNYQRPLSPPPSYPHHFCSPSPLDVHRPSSPGPLQTNESKMCKNNSDRVPNYPEPLSPCSFNGQKHQSPLSCTQRLPLPQPCHYQSSSPHFCSEQYPFPLIHSGPIMTTPQIHGHTQKPSGIHSHEFRGLYPENNPDHQFHYVQPMPAIRGNPCSCLQAVNPCMNSSHNTTSHQDYGQKTPRTVTSIPIPAMPLFSNCPRLTAGKAKTDLSHNIPSCSNSDNNVSGQDSTHLPDALLLHIFSFLPTDSLCRCARVCHRWYQLAWDPNLWHRVHLGPELDVDWALMAITERLCRETPSVCLALEQLLLNGAPGPSDAGLLAVAQRCPELRHLELAGCTRITNQGLLEVVTCCPNLEHLDVSDCPEISCVSITPEASCHACLLRGRHLSIRHLDMSGCSGLSDDGLLAVALHCPGLLHLYLRRCTNLSDAGLSSVARHCPALRELSLCDCPVITDVGLREVALGLGPSLRYLSLAHCSRLSDAGLRYLARHCPGLRYLNARGLPGLTDQGLEFLGRGCPRLRSLDVGRCSLVTDAGLEAIAKGCSGLKRLSMRDCCGVTGSGLRSVAMHCPELQLLSVQGCRLPADALRCVQRRCRRCTIEHTSPGYV
uniref:uncharacterized protein n=1 Tax=Myxine glutinosa TaxID=7769 RepID=UPI00358FA3C0